MSEYNLSKIKLSVWFKGLLFLFVCIFLYKVSDIIALFVSALVCAYFLNILIHFIEQKGLTRESSIIISILLTTLALSLLWLFLYPPLVKQMSQIKQGVTVYISDIHAKGVVDSMKRNSSTQNEQKSIDDNLKKQLDYMISGLSVKYPSLIASLGGREKVASFIYTKQQQIISFIISLLGDFSSRAVSFLSHVLNLIFIPILCIYFLFAEESLKKRIVYIIERTAYKHEILSFFKEVNSMLSSYLKSQLLIMVLTSIVITVLAHFVSSFFGTKYSLFLGCLTGITCVVPYFGALISMITAVVLCLATASNSPFVAAIIMLVLMIIVNQIFDNYVTPKIVGESVGIHPLFSIFALLTAGKLAGFIGMLLAVPIAGVINIIVLRTWPQFFPRLPDKESKKSGEKKSVNVRKHGVNNKEYHPKALIRIPPLNPNNMSPFLVNEKKNEEGLSEKKNGAIHKSLNVPKKKKEAQLPPSDIKDMDVNEQENKQDTAKMKPSNRRRSRYPRPFKNKKEGEDKNK